MLNLQKLKKNNNNNFVRKNDSELSSITTLDQFRKCTNVCRII